MSQNELYHYGILGQKWGKKNGPPYPLDRDDHSSAEKTAARNNTGSPGAKWFTQDQKQGKDKPNTSRAEVVMRESKKITESGQDLVRDIHSIKNVSRKKPDLSQMSDKDLRDAVNRMNLERQYYQLTEPELSKGEQYATKALSIAGDVLAIGLSTAGIIASIYAIKRG